MLLTSSSHPPPGAEALVLIVPIAAVLAYVIFDARRHHAAYSRVAGAIGAEITAWSTTEFTATARGFTFKFHLSPGGKNSPARTYVHVTTPPFDLLLDLVKEGDRSGKMRAGYVDVEVGDPPFDSAWIVEGAPADRIQRLLADAPLRRRILACADAAEVEIQIEDGAVHFSKRGLDYKDGEVIPIHLELMLDLAEAVMREHALPSPSAVVNDGDYRSAPALIDGDRSDDRARITLLKRQRAERSVNRTRPILFVIPIAMVGATIVFFMATAHKAPQMARAIPLFELVMVMIVTNALWRTYFTERRTAGLPLDRALIVTVSVVTVIALVAATGAFGF